MEYVLPVNALHRMLPKVFIGEDDLVDRLTVQPRRSLVVR